ncbi:hypothetical protein EV424DRAFT_1550180 [Suillus variegatus]|nr:hypothetical protein EV424DRAFT_1550180 [Suillus variegatus]
MPKNWHNQDSDIPGPLQRSPSPPLPEPSAAIRSNRSGRIIRMPKRYNDFIPGDNIPEVAQADEIMPEEEIHAGNELIPFETDPDAMGLYRVYATRPTLFPQSPLNSLCDTPMLQSGPNNTPVSASALVPPSLCPSLPKTSTLLSVVQLPRLTTFLDDDAYNRDDIRIFSATREKRLIAEYLEDQVQPFQR